MKRPARLDDIGDIGAYRPTSGRRRLLIAALAVSTAVVVMWLMLRPQLRLIDAQQNRKTQGPPPCAASQTQGCLGGTMSVISPAPPAASVAP